jgi:hypothetical protein
MLVFQIFLGQDWSPKAIPAPERSELRNFKTTRSRGPHLQYDGAIRSATSENNSSILDTECTKSVLSLVAKAAG